MKRVSGTTLSRTAARPVASRWCASRTATPRARSATSGEFVSAAPPDERQDLLLEAYEVTHALLTRHPALEPQRPFLDRIGAEITKSE